LARDSGPQLVSRNRRPAPRGPHLPGQPLGRQPRCGPTIPRGSPPRLRTRGNPPAAAPRRRSRLPRQNAPGSKPTENLPRPRLAEKLGGHARGHQGDALRCPPKSRASAIYAKRASLGSGACRAATLWVSK